MKLILVFTHLNKRYELGNREFIPNIGDTITHDGYSCIIKDKKYNNNEIILIC